MRHVLWLGAAVGTLLAFLAAADLVHAGARDLAAAYREVATPFRDEEADLDRIITAAADRQLVLLGESTHGTKEFYALRAEISRRLIAEHGFSFVAVEGDWMSIARLDRYVRHDPQADDSAAAALRAADRWPHWLWANEEFAEFAEWLHEVNRDRPPAARVGIYGMDVYAPWRALDALLDWYAAEHPDRLTQVRADYAMFARYRGDPNGYARAAMANPTVWQGVAAGRTLTFGLWEAAIGIDSIGRDALKGSFRAAQKAAVIERAEQFYRMQPAEGSQSWNWRARHMQETVARLLSLHAAEAAPTARPARGIVWAHNTHIGDARATAMANRGAQNIGQLARQAYGDDNVFLVGLATYQGQALAARRWDGAVERMDVPSPPPGSFEATLQRMEVGNAVLVFPHRGDMAEPLRTVLGHRAVGVVYAPAEDHRRNYLPSIPALRYDALIFLEDSEPLTPLH